VAFYGGSRHGLILEALARIGAVVVRDSLTVRSLRSIWHGNVYEDGSCGVVMLDGTYVWDCDDSSSGGVRM
jgi:hypothetical protein